MLEKRVGHAQFLCAWMLFGLMVGFFPVVFDACMSLPFCFVRASTIEVFRNSSQAMHFSHGPVETFSADVLLALVVLIMYFIATRTEQLTRLWFL